MSDEEESKKAMLAGRGSWYRFDRSIESVENAAREWRSQVRGIEKPWLCWHLSEPWTRIQVNIVRYYGWTPIVGFDPDCGTVQAPEIQDALVIDFNKHFSFKKMSMQFPLEFMHLWTERLAFWHSDLLVRQPLMLETSTLFSSVPDGEMAGTPQYGNGFFDRFAPRKHRMWELIGLTTAGASEDQFSKGLGWWRHFWMHPNCPSAKEREKRSKYYYDHGTGVMYWHRNYGGKIHKLDTAKYNEGHCTSISNPNYVKIKVEPGRRLVGKQLELNFDLAVVAERLGLSQFL